MRPNIISTAAILSFAVACAPIVDFGLPPHVPSRDAASGGSGGMSPDVGQREQSQAAGGVLISIWPNSQRDAAP